MKNPIKLESESESNAAAAKHKGAKQKWRGGEGGETQKETKQNRTNGKARGEKKVGCL
jgi:hypothetical protein